MNREEEIKQAIKDICGCKSCKIDKDYCPFCKERNVAIEAINWADHYPKKGLWDANKVLAWISQNIESYCKLNAKNFNNLLFDLGKSMEE